MQIKKHPHKNLNKNRILYFQIGLALVLLISFISIEWKSYGKTPKPELVEVDIDYIDEPISIHLPVKDPKPIEERKTKNLKKDPLPDKKNDKPDEILNNPKPESTSDPDQILSEIEPPIPAPIADVPSVSVEEFPVFPGCEIYNGREDRKTCMSKKIYKLIGKHFDRGIANDLNLKGLQKIYTTFRVSHTGEVIFIEARAPHPELQKEAERIILKIPDMSPGKMGGKPVNVLFSIPINFKIN